MRAVRQRWRRRHTSISISFIKAALLSLFFSWPPLPTSSGLSPCKRARRESSSSPSTEAASESADDVDERRGCMADISKSEEGSSEGSLEAELVIRTTVSHRVTIWRDLFIYRRTFVSAPMSGQAHIQQTQPIRKLSKRQESRLVDYVEDHLLEISGQYKKRSALNSVASAIDPRSLPGLMSLLVFEH